MNFLTRKSVKSQNGFTLVELSMVVLVAGLMLAAVMKGQSMLESSRAQQLLHHIKNVEALIGRHSNQKGRLPGDCNADGAVDLPLAGLLGASYSHLSAGHNSRAALYDYTDTPLDLNQVNYLGNFAPCVDGYSTGILLQTSEANANRWINDLKNANIISRNTNNRAFAKHVAEDFIFVGKWIETTEEDYNAITIAGVPVAMAKQILLHFNRSEVSSATGKMRVFTDARTFEESTVFAARSNNDKVNLIYFYRNQPL